MANQKPKPKPNKRPDNKDELLKRGTIKGSLEPTPVEGVPTTPLEYAELGATLTGSDWLYPALPTVASSNAAAQLIDQWRGDFGIREEWQEEWTRRSGVQTALYKLTVKKGVGEGGVEMVGVGRGVNKTEAKRAARADLARRILALPQVVLDPVEVGKEGGKRGKFVDSKVAWSMETSVGSSLQRLFTRLNETACFEQIEEEEEAGSERVSAEQQARQRRVNVLTRSTPAEVQATKVPPSPFAHHLPIRNRFHEIIQSIESNSVTIISAGTGSGKSTQVPQFILDHFRQRGHGKRKSVRLLLLF